MNASQIYTDYILDRKYEWIECLKVSCTRDKKDTILTEPYECTGHDLMDMFEESIATESDKISHEEKVYAWQERFDDMEFPFDCVLEDIDPNKECLLRATRAMDRGMKMA